MEFQVMGCAEEIKIVAMFFKVPLHNWVLPKTGISILTKYQYT